MLAKKKGKGRQKKGRGVGGVAKEEEKRGDWRGVRRIREEGRGTLTTTPSALALSVAENSISPPSAGLILLCGTFLTPAFRKWSTHQLRSERRSKLHRKHTQQQSKPTQHTHQPGAESRAPTSSPPSAPIGADRTRGRAARGAGAWPGAARRRSVCSS